MKLEHFGMPEPGDCRVVFSAGAEELEAAVQAEQAAPDAPKEEEDLLTAAVNRAILEGFSPLFAQLMEEHRLVPVTGRQPGRRVPGGGGVLLPAAAGAGAVHRLCAAHPAPAHPETDP